jgi:DNA-binding LacI/PurR family transcriptional regulator
MEKLGIESNAELARLAGLNPTSTWRVLKNPNQVSVKNIYQILKALDLLNLNDGNGTEKSDNDTNLNTINELKEQLSSYQELMREYKDKAENYKQQLDSVKTVFFERKRKDDTENDDQLKKRKLNAM